MVWSSYIEGLGTLFDQGGLTLWAILFASLLLWALILERYLYFWTTMPALRKQLREQWDARPTSLAPVVLRRHLAAIVADLRAESQRNMLALNALVSILPLLGLLGTVSGMIKVFEVITLFGTGNTRGMAAGISEALVTTMAGLFTALSGMYFVSDIERRAEDTSRRFESELVEAQ